MAMALFLSRNGYEIGGTIDEQETIILRVAAGEAGQDELVQWLEKNVIEKE